MAFDVLVAEHELDLQAGVFRMEPVQNARLGQAKGDGFRAGQANDPDIGAAQIAQGLFKALCRCAMPGLRRAIRFSPVVWSALASPV